MDDTSRLQNAIRVVENLEQYTPGALPERPEVLTYDDGQIYDSVHKNERGVKLSKEAKSQLQFFSLWRSAVERTESVRTGNLILLVACVQLLEEADDYPRSVLIRDWVWRRHKARIPEPVPTNYARRERWAKRFAEDRQAFPIHLRIDTPPPAGKTTHATGSESESDEYPDDPNEPSF